ncbi:hypothetical protein ABQF17_22355 [Mycolicibacterium elephantis]
MKKIICRSMVMAAAAAPIAALSVAMSAVGAAQPINCPPGQWWDPVDNVCRGPVATVPLNCPTGQYWNPITNLCRPLGHY